MIWQETPHAIPLLAMSVFSAAMGIYMWFRYHSPIGRVGSVTILASTEWVLTYALNLASSDLPSKIFWRKMMYPGVVMLPTAWFIFAILYTGREKWLKRRNLVGLSLMPGITLLLTFTNESHGLIWSSVTLRTTGSFVVSDVTFGLWLWIFVGYAYALLSFGAFFFLVQIIRSSRSIYRWQISILLFGGMLPWLANALLSFGLGPFPHLDLTPVALIMTTATVAFNIFYFRLGEVVPLARELIIEGMSDGFIILDAENRIVDLNPSAQRLMGIDDEPIEGKPVEEVWPQWSGTAGFDDASEKGKEIVLEEEQRIYDVSISPLTDWLDRTVSRVVVLRDVTDRKRSEKIKQSLREKEILLQEIHHRVKNNIQVISSLLRLQSYYIKDEKHKEMLRESQARIRSMALVHEKLYRSENLAAIDLSEYITDLVKSLFRSYGAKNITFKVEGTVSLGIDTAIPCGLIINELVSNSLKHAFPDNQGEILVELSSVNENVELTVSDNGVGIPEDVDFRTTESLGLHLVTMLAEHQLEGEISLDRAQGTAFHITFKRN